MGCEPEIYLLSSSDYFGHIMRNNKHRMLQNIVQGNSKGARDPKGNIFLGLPTWGGSLYCEDDSQHPESDKAVVEEDSNFFNHFNFNMN